MICKWLFHICLSLQANVCFGLLDIAWCCLFASQGIFFWLFGGLVATPNWLMVEKRIKSQILNPNPSRYPFFIFVLLCHIGVWSFFIFFPLKIGPSNGGSHFLHEFWKQAGPLPSGKRAGAGLPREIHPHFLLGMVYTTPKKWWFYHILSPE